MRRTKSAPYIRLMADALLQLKQLVDAVHPLAGEDWEALSGIWSPFSAGRKEILTTEGAMER